MSEVLRYKTLPDEVEFTQIGKIILNKNSTVTAVV